MKKDVALKAIAWISLAGLLFSGYLSFIEITQQKCAMGTTCSTVFTIPACVYGFVMYLIVMIISLLGLNQKKN